MSIALRNRQTLALLILAIVTVLILSLIVLSAVTHTDVWNLWRLIGGTVKPNGVFCPCS